MARNSVVWFVSGEWSAVIGLCWCFSFLLVGFVLFEVLPDSQTKGHLSKMSRGVSQLLVSSLLVFAFATTALAFSGDATYYNVGLGACGNNNNNNQLVAALVAPRLQEKNIDHQE